jgi:hypothetical protein
VTAARGKAVHVGGRCDRANVGSGYHSDHIPAACSQMLADGAAVNALDSAFMCAWFA